MGDPGAHPYRRPWTTRVLDDLIFASGRNDTAGMQFRMSLRDYADLRKFSRDVLDFEVDRVHIQEGCMAHIYGIPIFVRKSVPNGLITLFDSEDRDLAHIIEDGELHSGECRDPMCLIKSVMLT